MEIIKHNKCFFTAAVVQSKKEIVNILLQNGFAVNPDDVDNSKLL